MLYAAVLVLTILHSPRSEVVYLANTRRKTGTFVQSRLYLIRAAGACRESGLGAGTIVYSDATHLHGPPAMIEAPNGHLIVANNDNVNGDPNQPSELVEFTKDGRFVKQISVDPLQDRSFGLAVGRSLSQ